MAHRTEVNLYLYRDGNNDSFIDGIYLISLTKVFISVNEYADLSQTSSVRRCLYVWDIPISVHIHTSYLIHVHNILLAIYY